MMLPALYLPRPSSSFGKPLEVDESAHFGSGLKNMSLVQTLVKLPVLAELRLY